jgi:aromatic-L-amino-acid decarboxylase
VQVAIDLAQRTQQLIEESEHLEMVRPSSLSIVLFRRRGWDADRYNAWSEQLLHRQIAFVTPTKWEGETVGRIAFLHPNTTEEMVIEILDSLRD